MTIAFVNATGGTFSKALSGALTLDTTSGDRIIVKVGVEGNQTVTGITDSVGTVYSLVPGTAFNNGAGVRIEVWQGKAAGTSATNSITVTLSAKTTFSFDLDQYSGNNGGIDNVQTGTGTNNNLIDSPTANTLSNAANWLWAGCALAVNQTISINTIDGDPNLTIRVQTNGDATGDNQGLDPAGVVSPIYKTTAGSTAWCFVAFELVAAAASASKMVIQEGEDYA